MGQSGSPILTAWRFRLWQLVEVGPRVPRLRCSGGASFSGIFIRRMMRRRS